MRNNAIYTSAYYLQLKMLFALLMVGEAVCAGDTPTWHFLASPIYNLNGSAVHPEHEIGQAAIAGYSSGCVNYNSQVPVNTNYAANKYALLTAALRACDSPSPAVITYRGNDYSYDTLQITTSGYLSSTKISLRANVLYRNISNYLYYGTIQVTAQKLCPGPIWPNPDNTCPVSYKLIPTAAHDATDCRPCRGNPVDIATGEKIQEEQDITPSPNGVLSFTRYYGSQTVAGDYSALGQGWRNTYSRTLDVKDSSIRIPGTIVSSTAYTTASAACTSGWSEVSASGFRGLASGATASYTNGLCKLTINGAVAGKLAVMQSTSSGPATSGTVHTISRPNGMSYVFEQVGDAWNERYGAAVTLVQVTDGWLFTDKNGTLEHYDVAGRLTTITDRAENTETLSYDPNGLLTSVSDAYGHELRFTYDASGRISTVTDPNGGIFRYDYDASNRLVSVSFPDNTPETTSDDLIRRYLYEDSGHLYALTGIIDENGNRFASWTYDASGRAISSEHADGAERLDFTYNADGSTTVHEAGGGVQTYQFSVINGSLKVTKVIHQ